MRNLSNRLLIGILSGCALALLPVSSALSQSSMNSYAPYAGNSTADPLADQAFRMQLQGTMSMPNFVVIDDRAVGETPASQPQIAKGAAPNRLQPTLGKRPGKASVLSSPQPAKRAVAKPQMSFSGPPIRPAKPFVGWNHTRSQTASRPQARTPMNRPSAVALVPQYMAYNAESDKAMNGVNGTKLARSKSPAKSSKFLSLHSKPADSIARNSQSPCPNCGRNQRTQVANQPRSRFR